MLLCLLVARAPITVPIYFCFSRVFPLSIGHFNKMKLLALLWIALVSTDAFVIYLATVRQLAVPLFSPHVKPSLSLKMMDALEPSSLVDTVAAAAATIIAPPSDLSFRNVNVWIFLAGIFPFAWATVEFWRRIAVGESFGTGKDSVRIVNIGKDNAPTQSRGRQTLGQGALVVAYILFGLAAGIIGLTLYSVLTSTSPQSTVVLTEETLWLP